MRNWLSKRSRDEGSSTSPSKKKGNPSQIGWNVTAAFAVLLPLFMFMVSRVVFNRRQMEFYDNGDDEGEDNNEDDDDGAEDGDDGEGRMLWSSWNDPDYDGPGKGVIIFVYLWSLLMFLGLVWYGNGVLSGDRDSKKNLKKALAVLLTALLMFANLAFLILVLLLLLNNDDSNGGGFWNGIFGSVSRTNHSTSSLLCHCTLTQSFCCMSFTVVDFLRVTAKMGTTMTKREPLQGVEGTKTVNMTTMLGSTEIGNRTICRGWPNSRTEWCCCRSPFGCSSARSGSSCCIPKRGRVVGCLHHPI